MIPLAAAKHLGIMIIHFSGAVDLHVEDIAMSLCAPLPHLDVLPLSMADANVAKSREVSGHITKLCKKARPLSLLGLLGYFHGAFCAQRQALLGAQTSLCNSMCHLQPPDFGFRLSKIMFSHALLPSFSLTRTPTHTTMKTVSNSAFATKSMGRLSYDQSG